LVRAPGTRPTFAEAWRRAGELMIWSSIFSNTASRLTKWLKPVRELTIIDALAAPFRRRFKVAGVLLGCELPRLFRGDLPRLLVRLVAHHELDDLSCLSDAPRGMGNTRLASEEA
jgi:hypothetical protein